MYGWCRPGEFFIILFPFSVMRMTRGGWSRSIVTAVFPTQAPSRHKLVKMIRWCITFPNTHDLIRPEAEIEPERQGPLAFTSRLENRARLELKVFSRKPKDEGLGAVKKETRCLLQGLYCLTGCQSEQRASRGACVHVCAERGRRGEEWKQGHPGNKHVMCV